MYIDGQELAVQNLSCIFFIIVLNIPEINPKIKKIIILKVNFNLVNSKKDFSSIIFFWN